MRIVKLKSGFRITGTDGEFEALRFITEHGVEHALDRENQKGLSKSAKTAIHKDYFTQPGGPLAVFGDDRRDAG